MSSTTVFSKRQLSASGLAMLIASAVILPAAAAPEPARPVDPALQPVIPPLIILAPTEVRTEPTLARGCWVKLFPEPDFKGDDNLTVAGPIALPSLHTPRGGVEWKEKTESLIVGPKAVVTVFENEQFSHQSAELKPGTREPRLRGNLKFTQSIDSLKIRCNKTPA